MTPRLAPPDRPLHVALAGALALLAALWAGATFARPLDLSTDAGLAAFAQWVLDYRAVAGARWVIAAKDPAQAEAKRQALANLLPPRDIALIERVEIAADAGGAPRAWMSPVVGGASSGASCSWQVWVDDPTVPGPSQDPVMTLLAPNDRIVVAPQATFRVGHAGLVQSHLYAFGETRAGAVRDLASAPDVNIPAARDPVGETIILATAREPSPVFENVKSALAQAQGERLELGPRYDLRDKLLGGGRGIGANIQAIPDSMIAAPSSATGPAGQKNPPPSALIESCVYQMTARP